MTGAVGPLQRWRDALDAWAIPTEILAQAPASPWGYPTRIFAADRTDELADSPSHRIARRALGDGGSVLDVGCGGGRSSVPLAAVATYVTGVDEQASMLANFAAAFERSGLPHREVLGRWPEVASSVERADVAVCHHVLYNVADIDEFVRALTNHADRRVVVELSGRHPISTFAPLWQHFWRLDRPHGPSADLFVEIVESLGLQPDVEYASRPPRKPSLEDAGYVEFVRRRLCLGPERDGEIAAQLAVLDPGSQDETVTVAWAGSNPSVSSRS